MAEPKHDSVDHPVHYGSHPSGIECIEVTRHMSFNRGNAVKYIWRADLKNGIEDPGEGGLVPTRRDRVAEEAGGRTEREAWTSVAKRT